MQFNTKNSLTRFYQLAIFVHHIIVELLCK